MHVEGLRQQAVGLTGVLARGDFDQEGRVGEVTEGQPKHLVDLIEYVLLLADDVVADHAFLVVDFALVLDLNLVLREHLDEALVVDSCRLVAPEIVDAKLQLILGQLDTHRAQQLLEVFLSDVALLMLVSHVEDFFD